MGSSAVMACEGLAAEEGRTWVKDVEAWRSVVRHRAEVLAPEDRRLLLDYHDRGLRLMEIAIIHGISRATVCRRLRVLEKHLTGRRTGEILRRRHLWRGVDRLVAEAHFLRRRSLRRTAAESGLTLHQVRSAVRRIRRQVP